MCLQLKWEWLDFQKVPLFMYYKNANKFHKDDTNNKI